MSGQSIGDISDWNNFHGKAYVGTFSSSTTISLSYLPGYKNLTNDNFYYDMCAATISSIQCDLASTATAKITPPTLTYNASTGMLSVDGAVLTVINQDRNAPYTNTLNPTINIYLLK